MPNPAVDIVKVNLRFLEKTQTAQISLMNGLGQFVASEQLRNFEEGQVRFDVHDLASGTYLLSVRTPEGVAIRQLAVCH